MVRREEGTLGPTPSPLHGHAHQDVNCSIMPKVEVGVSHKRQLSDSSEDGDNNISPNNIKKFKVEVGVSHKRQLSDSSEDGDNNISPNNIKKFKCQAGVPTRVSIGDKINALQHLVSPFGKTDTASVLKAAIGYIKFLQDQVQVLSSPYLNTATGCHQVPGGVYTNTSQRSTTMGVESSGPDLRSRGLCLVPVASTLSMSNENGADYWISGLGVSSR